MPRITLRIRPTILSVFIFLTFLVLTVTLSLQYYFQQKLVEETLDKRIQSTSNHTYKELSTLQEKIKDSISLIEILDDIKIGVQEKSPHPIFEKIRFFVKNNPYIYSMYISYENGEFLELINLNIHSSLKEEYKTSPNEQWLAFKIFKKDGINTRLNIFLDEDFKPTRKYSEQSDYNPTTRDWYLDAQKSDGIIESHPYQYAHANLVGITYAKAIKDKKLTIAVDISLESLSSFLKEQISVEGTKIFLIDGDNNNLLTSSENNIDKKFLDLLEKNIKDNETQITLNNEDYFLSTSLLSDVYFKQRLIILTPKKEIMKSFNNTVFIEIIGNMMLLILIIPLIYYLTHLISNPILNLIKENKKIKNKNYDEVILVNTRIKEIHELSLSLLRMSRSIKRYATEQEQLIDSFIELIASTIDSKSIHTGGHCRKVPIILMKLVEEASKKEDGFFKDFSIKDKKELREISIAANLHDCGKIITPEYVIDKAVKLDTFYNRIHEIRTRFEVIYRDLKIKYLEDKLGIKDKEVEIALKNELNKLQEEFAFIASCNMGTEFMQDEDKQKVKDIGKKEWIRYFDDSLGLSNEERLRYVKNSSSVEKLLDDKQSHLIKREFFDFVEYIKFGFKLEVPEYLYNNGEIYNLCIERGTINKEERFKINEHIITTIKMLSSLPFPNNLSKVTEYAGNHHETLIGTGYPRKLVKEQMSITSRMMALADVFEALTANDRPYKAAKKLSETIKILIFMVKDKHLDEDIFQLFIESKIYLSYAKEYLLPEQLDLETTEEILSKYKN